MIKRRSLSASVWMFIIAALFPSPAAAYVGPGAGLSAIGAFFALAIALIAALLGFIWYPLKRLLQKLRTSRTIPDSKTDEPSE